MQIKWPLKTFFLLFPGSITIFKSYRTQALDIARLDPNQDISQIENEKQKVQECSHFFGFYI